MYEYSKFRAVFLEILPLMRCMFKYSETTDLNRVLSRHLKLSVLSVGSRRSSLSEFQAVGPVATANARRPYELRLCRGTTSAVDWPHRRLECSSCQVLCDEGS